VVQVTGDDGYIVRACVARHALHESGCCVPTPPAYGVNLKVVSPLGNDGASTGAAITGMESVLTGAGGGGALDVRAFVRAFVRVSRDDRDDRYCERCNQAERCEKTPCTCAHAHELCVARQASAMGLGGTSTS
jgi:hypothetical protein